MHMYFCMKNAVVLPCWVPKSTNWNVTSLISVSSISLPSNCNTILLIQSETWNHGSEFNSCWPWHSLCRKKSLFSVTRNLIRYFDFILLCSVHDGLLVLAEWNTCCRCIEAIQVRQELMSTINLKKPPFFARFSCPMNTLMYSRGLPLAVVCEPCDQPIWSSYHIIFFL